ncbi:unnamed protein product [Ixodes pacificus]
MCFLAVLLQNVLSGEKMTPRRASNVMVARAEGTTTSGYCRLHVLPQILLCGPSLTLSLCLFLEHGGLGAFCTYRLPLVRDIRAPAPLNVVVPLRRSVDSARHNALVLSAPRIERILRGLAVSGEGPIYRCPGLRFSFVGASENLPERRSGSNCRFRAASVRGVAREEGREGEVGVLVCLAINDAAVREATEMGRRSHRGNELLAYVRHSRKT